MRYIASKSIDQFKHFLSEVNWESFNQLKDANNVYNRLLFIFSSLYEVLNIIQEKKNSTNIWKREAIKMKLNIETLKHYLEL